MDDKYDRRKLHLDRQTVYDGLFALLNGRSEFHRAYISNDNRGKCFTLSAFEEASSAVNFYRVVDISIDP